jgi:hypothetical protein
MYEGLPWLYIACGAAALGASYRLEQRFLALSLTMGLAGIAAVIVGVAVLLRRRDFRDLRSRYGETGAPGGGDQD